MAELNKADGDVLSASDIDDIDEQLVIQATSNPTGVAGRIVARTDLNRFLVYEGSGWVEFGGFHWQSFTPTWGANLTIGNGTQAAEYRYMPGELQVRGYITFGSTTSISGGVSQTIPNSETIRTAATGTVTELGSATYRDVTGPASYGGVIQYGSTTTVNFLVWNCSGTYPVATALSSTVPFTWTTSDLFRYEYRIPVS